MTAASAVKDARVREMSDKLYSYLAAGWADEDGVECPDGLDQLDGFLEELVEHVLDRHGLPCPLVQPQEGGEITLAWRPGGGDSLCVDVYLPTRMAEHRILADYNPGGTAKHELRGAGWETLGRKAALWQKSVMKRNSTG